MSTSASALASSPPVAEKTGALSKLDRRQATGEALKLFRRYGRPYAARFFLAFVCLIVAGTLALAFPLFVGKLMDSALTYRNMAELNRTLVLLMVILGVQAVFSFGRTYLLNYFGENLVADMRRDLYAHLVRLSVTFFANRRVGELTSRLASDITIIQTSSTVSLAESLRQLIILVGGVTIMLYTNTRLTLIVLGVLPLMIVTGVLFGRSIRRISTRIQDRLADSASVLEETLAGIRTVQSFAREEYEINRYATLIGQARKEAMRRAMARGGFNAFIVFILFGGIVGMLWYSGHLVISGLLTIGQLTTFLLYASIVGTALGAFTELYGEFQQTLGASQRVIELFGTVSEIADEPNAQAVEPVRGLVEFKNVVFAYPGREETRVLNGINAVARPGEVVALVGPSGAGKSTFISLIPRFYDVQQGAVFVDGLDIRSWRLHDLRENIGIVPQETTLFADTIRNNIAYGRLTATTEDIEAAARAAHAHEFITGFPNGYDTLVGERGVKLSGGQRQRIAIARALLKNPRILILDEATSSLDSESERLVQEALDVLMQGRTTFVIAHRLSTVRRADRILVIHQGRIIEEGTHTELIEKGGMYKKLYNLQFRDLPLSEIPFNED